MITRAAPALGALVLSLLVSLPALAVPLFPNLLTVNDGNGTMTLTDEMLGCQPDPDNGDLFSCIGTNFVPADPNFQWRLDNWNLQFDLDPFVSQAFGFSNVGPAATFTLTTTIPIAPIPLTLMGGSTGGSVTDADFDGLGGIATAAPDAFYSGLIDGVPVGPAADLHPDPFAVGFAFPGHTASIPSVFFGLPGPTVPGPAVGASIGIRNKFTLSGGDSIASTNFFVVQIPEPGSGLLLGAALGALALLRRRR